MALEISCEYFPAWCGYLLKYILDGETGDSWSQNKKFILHFVNITRLWLHKDSDEKKKKKRKKRKILTYISTNIVHYGRFNFFSLDRYSLVVSVFMSFLAIAYDY